MSHLDRQWQKEEGQGILRINLGLLDDPIPPGYWEARAIGSESSWLTIWAPQCPICGRTEPVCTSTQMGPTRLEFEFNAPMWSRVRRDACKRPMRLSFACRVSQGVMMKPCRGCCDREKELRKKIQQAIETTVNRDWPSELLRWIRSRTKEDYDIRGDIWMTDSLQPSGNPKTDRELQAAGRARTAKLAVELLDKAWKRTTLCNWEDVDAKPGTVDHWKESRVLEIRPDAV